MFRALGMVEDNKANSSLKSSVLVVDDDNLTSEILKFYLEREGYEVLRAKDGRECQKIVETMSPPKLVLLDIIMPYIDGFQLIKQIREESEWSEVPILMLTSKDNEEDIVRALDAGAKRLYKETVPAERADGAPKEVPIGTLRACSRPSAMPFHTDCRDAVFSRREKMRTPYFHNSISLSLKISRHKALGLETFVKPLSFAEEGRAWA